MSQDAPDSPAIAPSPADEIARFLELFALQVGACARETEEPVAAVAHCMLSVAAGAGAISEIALALPAGSEERVAIERLCASLIERIQAAVVALQFHDLHTQRLQHVCEGIGELAAGVREARARSGGPELWRAVGERIRARYTLQEQLALFDQLVTGVTTADTPAPQAPPGPRRRVEIF